MFCIRCGVSLDETYLLPGDGVICPNCGNFATFGVAATPAAPPQYAAPQQYAVPQQYAPMQPMPMQQPVPLPAAPAPAHYASSPRPRASRGGGGNFISTAIRWSIMPVSVYYAWYIMEEFYAQRDGIIAEATNTNEARAALKQMLWSIIEQSLPMYLAGCAVLALLWFATSAPRN